MDRGKPRQTRVRIPGWKLGIRLQTAVIAPCEDMGLDSALRKSCASATLTLSESDYGRVCPWGNSDAMTECGQAQLPRHSALSALIGSMRDALRAGMNPAMMATNSNASAIPR
jgi:hypothetical protein